MISSIKKTQENLVLLSDCSQGSCDVIISPTSIAHQHMHVCPVAITHQQQKIAMLSITRILVLATSFKVYKSHGTSMVSEPERQSVTIMLGKI